MDLGSTEPLGATAAPWRTQALQRGQSGRGWAALGAEALPDPKPLGSLWPPPPWGPGQAPFLTPGRRSGCLGPASGRPQCLGGVYLSLFRVIIDLAFAGAQTRARGWGGRGLLPAWCQWAGGPARWGALGGQRPVPQPHHHPLNPPPREKGPQGQFSTSVISVTKKIAASE